MYISSTFRSQVLSFDRKTFRASCWVMVYAPWVTRRLRIIAMTARRTPL